jgi:outer membrane lipoprotein-sorting protein
MKRNAFLILLICLAPGRINAQDGARAKALLDEVYNKVMGYENIVVDFKFDLYNSEADISQETRGNVTLKGDMYYLNYMGAEQLYDGKKVYTIVPENEEVTIDDKSEDSGTVSPSYVRLTPIDSNSEVASILLGIDVETKHIYKLIETGKNGTKTTISVNSFKTDQPLSKTLFTFDEKKYTEEGYYIIRN